MIKLIGEKLRQYDLNRTVELIPKHGHTVDAVMFHRGPEPLMTAHREEDGKIVADIPNILLKSFGTLTVECHLIDENGYRISERASFYISKREMPADYAYEETPILTLGKGGGVSSWNDLTDKPFYKEQSEKVVLEEQTVVTEAGFDHAIGVLVPNEAEIFDGETYEVVFNGEKYICVAKTLPEGLNKIVAVGNAGLSAGYVSSVGVEDTGEPFCFVAGHNFMLGTKEAGTYTISAKRITETIHHMSSEYLKLGNGLTVDENGAIALSLPNAEGGSF